MYYKGLFKKRISVRQGEKLLTEYCKLNGFDDKSCQWKKTTHAKHWFAYKIRGHRMISRNWVSYHHTRDNAKYSIWIDLVTEDIIEILRHTA